MVRPYQFSNRAERWVGRKCARSVVSCEFRAIKPSSVRERWDLIAPILGQTPEAREQRRKREHDSKQSMWCTGFFMAEDAEAMYLFTCAHVLGPVFNAANPLTFPQANDLFHSFILCDHRERRARHGEDDARQPTRVEIHNISCFRDLMVLRIGRFRLSRYCEHRHPVLRIAREFPAEFKTVILVSWPPLRNRTRAMGHVSHEACSLVSVARENPYNYTMMLSEVNMNSEFGSSGAPLVYGDVRVVGVLHGGENGVSSSLCKTSELS